MNRKALLGLKGKCLGADIHIIAIDSYIFFTFQHGTDDSKTPDMVGGGGKICFL